MPEGKLIYVVDDDPDISEFCKVVLGKKGHQVKAFLSVEAGLAAIRQREPDLLLLDVMIEEADSGFKAAQALAKTNPSLPILMLSAIADAAGQIFDTSSLPVCEFVEKPLAPDMLVKLAERLLAKRAT
jgi:DNA-binding NtrC family response regulator